MTIHSIKLDDYFKENNTTFADTPLAKVLNKLDVYPKHGMYMAGGAVRKTISGRDILVDSGDVDFFFQNRAAYRRLYFKLKNHKRFSHMVDQAPRVKNFYMYIGDYPQPPEVPFSFDLFDAPINTASAYTFDTPKTLISIQLIHFKYFESMEALLDRFDFTVCQFGITKDKLYYGDKSLGDNLFNKLNFNCTENMRAIVEKRWWKYIHAGFKPSPQCQETFERIQQWVRENPGVTDPSLNDYTNV